MLSNKLPPQYCITFLATGGALIDVQKGELTLQVNDEKVKFNIHHTLKFPYEVHTCHKVDIIKACVREAFHDMWPSDPLEHYLVSSSSMKNEVATQVGGDEFYAREDKFMCCVFALEALQCDFSFNDKKENLEVIIPPNSNNDGPLLKQLPEHLHYAFLGEDSTLSVIIATTLSKDEEEKLIAVLRSHKSTLAWSIPDIKGISPSICMHKILMDESYKPSIEP